MFVFSPVSRSVSTPLELLFVFGDFGYSNNNIYRYNGTVLSTDSATMSSGATKRSVCSTSGAAFIGDSTATLRLFSKYNGVTRSDILLDFTASAGVQGAAVLSSLKYFAFSFSGGTTNSYINRLNDTTLTTNVANWYTNGSAITHLDYAMVTLPATSKVYAMGGQPISTHPTVIRSFNGTSVSTESATITNGSYGAASAVIGSNLFIFGGYKSNNADTIRIGRYDGTTYSVDSSTIAGTEGGAFGGVGGAGSAYSNAFIFGGQNSTTLIQRYDGSTRTTDSATLATAMAGLRNNVSSISFSPTMA